MYTEDDIKKFYHLYFRYNQSSPNIGIVGTHDRFINICKEIKNQYKKKPGVFIHLNDEKNKLTIIDNDIETSYIYINDSNAMIGRYFRKYM